MAADKKQDLGGTSSELTEEKRPGVGGVAKRSSISLVAEFLASVGVGNRFTKFDLIAAVPNVAQVDRRMRDLREHGWVIDNYKVNPSLPPNEYLIREIGVRIDLGVKPEKTGRKTIGGAKRRRILERDGKVCVICGVPAGGTYPDIPSRRAVLTVGHLIPVARGGTDDDSNLRAECNRCGDEARDNTLDPPSSEAVLTRARNLRGLKEKKRLFSWMVTRRKDPDDTEQVFFEWRRLPHDEQTRVMQEFSIQVLGTDED